MAAWLEPHPDRTPEQEVDEGLLDELLAARLAMAPEGIEQGGADAGRRYDALINVWGIVSMNWLHSLTEAEGVAPLRASLLGLAAAAMAWVEGIDADARAGGAA